MKNFWGQRTFVVVTGASRGLGKAIALEFSKNVKAGSTFLLIARSMEGLEETKREMLSTSAELQVHLLRMDLTQLNSTTISAALFQSKTASSNNDEYEHLLIVHNAGVPGNIRQRLVELEDFEELQNFWTLEITSMLLLNALTFKMFPNVGQKSIVSITSDCATTPYKTWGLYCAGKCAKDMLMKCIALEGEGVQVLSYDPVLMDTQFHAFAKENTGDEDVRGLLLEEAIQGRVLPPDVHAKKLVELLATKRFVKGEHVGALSE